MDGSLFLGVEIIFEFENGCGRKCWLEKNFKIGKWMWGITPAHSHPPALLFSGSPTTGKTFY